MSDRKDHIEVLKKLANMGGIIPFIEAHSVTVQDALIFAINSLEVPTITLDELKEIRQKIGNYKLSPQELEDMDEDSVKWGMAIAIGIIDKHIRAEGEEVEINHWIDDADHYICPVCRFIVANPNHFIGRRCPNCGFQDKKDKEQKDD